MNKDNTIEVNNNDEPEIHISTATQIKYKGITLSPKFDSKGILIPIVTSECLFYYQRIPKDVIISMLKEYLPEIIHDII